MAPMPTAAPRTAPAHLPGRRTLAALAAPVALACALLAGCTAAAPPWAPDAGLAAVAPLLPADVLLLGEQHDAPEHQRLQRDTVAWLAQRGQLAALVLEMAEAGTSTAGLSPDATEAQIQAALQWQEAAWPWRGYGPTIVAAVRAGVPVLGGNLPRAELRTAMAQPAWDDHLPPAALARQHQAMRDGHCGLLPESQIAPMARVQLARDARMALVARQAMQPGRVVVLVAGAGHVLRSLGIPTHWPTQVRARIVLPQAGGARAGMADEADRVIATPALPVVDHCAALRAQWQTAPRPTPAQPLPASPPQPPTAPGPR